MSDRMRMDSRRRVTLPKDLVKDLKQEFVAIRTPKGIMLQPLPLDPIAALEKEGEKLKGKSIKRLKKEALETAMEEAENDLRRK
ncbi:MAG: AbrB family transcriptional regulator [Candidatus Woesearchaeota archaeon]|nr:AbrB family transcriptional regulator [Candidatus Woesearchaeota archaeon]